MFRKIIIILTILVQGINFENRTSKHNNIMDPDSLLITLSNKESLKFKEYKPKDFYKNKLTKIQDLTSSYKSKIYSNQYSNVEKFNRIFKVTIDTNNTNVFEMKKKLEKIDFIEDVDYNFKTYLEATINDTYASEQWEINHISLNNAWDISKGDAALKVGIIDSGIDANHPDLLGKVDSVLSKSFLEASQGTALQDLQGHGTFVAGIIGANTNNNAYVAGVCWNVSLVSLKTQRNDANGTGDVSDLAEAINYASRKNIDILNMSVGSYSYSSVLETAINNYDGLLIASAGNNYINTDNTVHYPSCFTNSNIISVGASIYNDSIWLKRENNTIVEGSNYGKVTVDLFAPGGDIVGLGSTSVYQSGIVIGSGTSLAAPYVTGVAALIKSKYPSLTPLQIKNRIMDNSTYSSVLGNYCVTGGVLNAYHSLTNQIHNHAFSYIQYDNTYHIKSCNRCGYKENEAHTWVADETIILSDNIVNPDAIVGFKCYYCNARKSTGIGL